MLKQVPQKVPQLLIKNHLVDRHLVYAMFSKESGVEQNACRPMFFDQKS